MSMTPHVPMSMPPSGPPGFPSMPPEGSSPGPWDSGPEKPPRTMALWSIGLSFLPGLPMVVGIVLALVVLGRTRRGWTNAGRGPAIGALCVSGAWIAIIALVVATSVGSDSLRDGAGAVATTRIVSLDQLQVGDCLDVPTRDEFSSVTLVPCTSPHHAEVYVRFDLPTGAYPGEDATIAKAEQGCADRFEAFVGEPYEESPLELVYGWPGAASWAEDKSVICVVNDQDRTTTESMRGVVGTVKPV